MQSNTRTWFVFSLDFFILDLVCPFSSVPYFILVVPCYFCVPARVVYSFVIISLDILKASVG
jgi:hypothetical protein